jgi:hypothetical protein
MSLWICEEMWISEISDYGVLGHCLLKNRVPLELNLTDLRKNNAVTPENAVTPAFETECGLLPQRML